MRTLSRFYACLGLLDYFYILKFLGQEEQIILMCARGGETLNWVIYSSCFADDAASITNAPSIVPTSEEVSRRYTGSCFA